VKPALYALAAWLVFAAGANGPARAEEPWRGVPVLMYHKVDARTPADAVGRSLTLEPQAFDAQLAWLRSQGIGTLTTRELIEALARGEQPRRTIVLTFDDGYEDAYRFVLPILRKYGMKASFYVSADFVGTPNHLTWTDLRAMRDAGMEIGCHGSRHLDLKTIPLSEKQYEIGHCAASLAKWLGRAPKTYAYAAGQYDAAALMLVNRYGFTAGLTERAGTVKNAAHPLELPRRRVDRTDSLAAFASIATP
jgi:peptidoglycan/xylan/chitin deacetylase (PgdA/CDA1 family)